MLEQTLPEDRYDAMRVNLADVRGTLTTGAEIELDDFSAASRLEFQFARDEMVRLLIDLRARASMTIRREATRSCCVK